jgi:hypothetical protein
MRPDLTPISIYPASQPPSLWHNTLSSGPRHAAILCCSPRCLLYQALCKLWASPEFIAKSKRARECRQYIGGHAYGLDGHIYLAKHMVRKICTNIYSDYIYATNSNPQECKTRERTSRVKCLYKVIGHITLHNPMSCALRWWQPDWWVVNILWLGSH